MCTFRGSNYVSASLFSRGSTQKEKNLFLKEILSLKSRLYFAYFGMVFLACETEFVLFLAVLENSVLPLG